MSGPSEVSESSALSEKPDFHVVDLIRDWSSANNDNLPLPEPDEATLRSTVFTADINRMRETLGELCKLSPSLSRAVIQWLAPQPPSAESAQSTLAALGAGASSTQLDSSASGSSAVPSTSSPSRQPLSISSLISSTDEPPAPSSGRKRRRSVNLAVCMYCREIFDENIGGSCGSHPGSLEPDWDNDYWADTKPEDDTSPDSDNRHVQVWSCCGGDGWAKVCRVGPHKAKFNPKKYKRQ